MPHGESPAYDVSSLNNNTSPRLFWKGRDSPSPFPKGAENKAPYDPEGCYFPAKRPSLENLKRVSKVKNHSMFLEGGQEYDPASVVFPQRPLASERSAQRDSQMNVAKSQFDEDTSRPSSPSKDQASPSKSSLSKGSRYGKGFDPQNDIWSEYGSAGHRHAKSVTFDHAPPQINEYEMTTPDLSSVASESRENSYESEEEGDLSFEAESSIERDDSFDASLEDVEKTPVVLPEDWRFMSPSTNSDGDPFIEDVEEGTTEDRPISREGGSSQHTRVESLDSNGERRPLPPLPSVNRMSGARPSSAGKLAAAFELGSAGQRVLPAPPAPASYTKSDIPGAMSIEERLRLMMLQDRDDDETHDDDAQNIEEPLELPRADETLTSKDDTHTDGEAKENFFSPPRISRDSILRGIRKGDSYEDDSFDDSSQTASSPQRYDHYDPDVPIPSMEIDDDDDSSSVIIKQEEQDEDLYSITDYYQNRSDNSLSSRDQRATYDEDSNYSLRSAAEATEREHAGHDTPKQGSEETTPNAETLADAQNPAQPNEDAQEYKEPNAPQDQSFDMASIRQSLARPITPDMQQDQASEPSTPDSVIRHPIEDDDDNDEDEDEHQEEEDEEEEEEPEPEHDESSSDESVPEPVATIRAPGAGLKTRPSLTPADMQSMAATRRQISGQHVPPVPSLTKQISNDSNPSDREHKQIDLPPKLGLPTDLAQRQSSCLKLDIPFSIQEESLGFGLDKEFDRVIESQKVAFHLALSQSPGSVPPSQAIPHKDPATLGNSTHPADSPIPKQRGYLMRQNTKVIIASSRNEEEAMPSPEHTAQDPRGTRSAGSSPRKPSQQTWTTVPWNGSARRPSIKPATGIPKKKPVPGAGGVPPLPGQPSNVQEAPATIEENEPAISESFEDGEERGRLFVKVVGLKYCDLPLPRGKTLS